MTVDNFTALLTPIIIALAASGGFWGFLQTRDTTKNATTQLMRGLAHNEIISQGMSYVERGWITVDEYEDFITYLWKPYSKVGGNGMAEKVVDMINGLPMRSGSMVVHRKEGAMIYD